jgi:hypothetical protein
MIGRGLSAAVYTQTTDVEVEVNGLMTYDREIIKPDVEKFNASNDALRLEPPTHRAVVPTGREKASEWSYTTENPGDGWEKPNFDDSAWRKGQSGFGTRMTPNTTVRTEWNTPNIWVRRTFELSADDVRDPSKLVLSLYHDEDALVYINGMPAATTTGYTTDYVLLPIMSEAAQTLAAGKNVIAIRCQQTQGGQYIDAGISRIIPPQNPNRVIW